jgi:hypothetical protein
MDLATSGVSHSLDIRLVPMTKQFRFGDSLALRGADGAGAQRMRFQYGIGAIGALFDEISVVHKNSPRGLRLCNNMIRWIPVLENHSSGHDQTAGKQKGLYYRLQT